MIATETYSIRKAVPADLLYVRKLPVQLGGASTAVLYPRKFRAMFHDKDRILFSAENEGGIIGFTALSIRARFLVFEFFAADRFAITSGLAAELEERANNMVTDRGLLGLIVDSEPLHSKVRDFYYREGYALHGTTLIKPHGFTRDH